MFLVRLYLPFQDPLWMVFSVNVYDWFLGYLIMQTEIMSTKWDGKEVLNKILKILACFQVL